MNLFVQLNNLNDLRLNLGVQGHAVSEHHSAKVLIHIGTHHKNNTTAMECESPSSGLSPLQLGRKLLLCKDRRFSLHADLKTVLNASHLTPSSRSMTRRSAG